MVWRSMLVCVFSPQALLKQKKTIDSEHLYKVVITPLKKLDQSLGTLAAGSYTTEVEFF